jgi:citrate synthase
MSSALCLIDGGRLYYRGRDAVVLSQSASFEDVAGLLWDGPCVLPAPLPKPNAGSRRALAALDFAAAAVAHLAVAAARDPAAVELSAERVRATGARILVELTALALGFRSVGGGIAARLCEAFGAGDRRVRRAIEAALVLCADHELNASAFAARVIAATGAAPYMSVVGALGALSGRRHGGMTESVMRLFDSREEPSAALSRELRSGEALPGFGHPLYPDGDPRARELLASCRKNAEQRRALELVAAAHRALGLHPNVDFGLVALCRAFGLPRHAPFVIFALGRSAGWVGHILEQYAAGTLIRPRARYVGVSPIGRTDE